MGATHRRLAGLIWLVAAGLLAGCSAPPPAGPDLPGLPAPPEAATLGAYRLQGCHGISAAADVPQALAAELTPRGFEPFVLVPGTVQLFLHATSCERAMFQDEVLLDYKQLLVSASVLPTNASWVPENAPARWVVDVFVSHDEAAASLAAAGLPARNVHIDVQSRAAGPATDRVWALDEAGSTLTLEFSHAQPAGVRDDVLNYLFTGAASYDRWSHEWTREFDQVGLARGVLAIDGLGTIGAALPTSAFPVYGAAEASVSLSARHEATLHPQGDRT